MELKLEVYESKDEDGGWGLRMKESEIECGDLLADIDQLLKKLNKRILKEGDIIKIYLQ